MGGTVMGLASIVIGEVIFGRYGSFLKRLIAIIVGSIIYRIIAVVIQLGLSTDDLKLLTAFIVARINYSSINGKIENRLQTIRNLQKRWMRKKCLRLKTCIKNI